MRLSKRSKSKSRRRRRSMRGGGLWDTIKGLNPFAKKEEQKPVPEAEPVDEGSDEIESHTVANDDLGSLDSVDAPASPGAQEGGRRRKRRKSRRRRRKSSKKSRSRRKSRRRTRRRKRR